MGVVDLVLFSDWKRNEMLLFCLLLHAEQVSARIVQEVTAEAVAVLKGERGLFLSSSIDQAASSQEALSSVLSWS